MNILDKYIIKKFLGTFVFMTLLLLAIFVTIDITEKLDRLLDLNFSIGELWDLYFFHFIIFYGNLFSPVFIFISVILVTSKMANNTEIIAIMSSGISYNRFLRPYVISATIITSISLLLSHWVIPESNKTRKQFEAQYIYKTYSQNSYDIYRQVKPGHFVYVNFYESKNAIGHGFSYNIFDNEVLKYSLESDYISWNEDSEKYELSNYKERILTHEQDIINSGETLDTVLQFDLNKLVFQDYIAETMNSKKLKNFLDDEQSRGSESMEIYLVEYYKRNSIPFATYLLILMGVSFSYRKKRGGTGINLSIGLFIAFLYIFLMQISSTLAIKSDFPVLLAVWLPNIIYVVITLLMHLKALRQT
ncbi:LptF/LptG family permease [Ichthyobacterium seriolicida]|uniref:YjgP/YjgQ family permease n=1 Tax=Ichthyobacterium seriolicida TaxID=242600 RepID=A0A1J1E3A0_9FLAO|nr:LptF/LptG family permease [Ichthyobacterium seriolicida]BAV94516.1 YjgP/YjgQ family permease [Ichthyobacterium seriolicida]